MMADSDSEDDELDVQAEDDGEAPLSREEQEFRAHNLSSREDEKDIVVKTNPWYATRHRGCFS